MIGGGQGKVRFRIGTLPSHYGFGHFGSTLNNNFNKYFETNGDLKYWPIADYSSTLRRFIKLLRSKPRVLKKESRSVESQRTEV